jgi:hypothetical protein
MFVPPVGRANYQQLVPIPAGWQTSVIYPPRLSAVKLADSEDTRLESSACRTEHGQSSGIVLLLTLLSSSGFFPAATKIESQLRSVATKHLAAAATGLEPKTSPSVSSGYTRPAP